MPRSTALRRLPKLAFWSALLVAFVCAILPAQVGPELLPWDKAQHFVVFYLLAALGAAAFPRRSLIAIGIWLSAFGALIEFVQAIPIVQRDADFWDWAADSVAILAALAPVLLTRWRTWAGQR